MQSITSVSCATATCIQEFVPAKTNDLRFYYNFKKSNGDFTDLFICVSFPFNKFSLSISTDLAAVDKSVGNVTRIQSIYCDSSIKRFVQIFQELAFKKG